MLQFDLPSMPGGGDKDEDKKEDSPEAKAEAEAAVTIFIQN